jgi:hypothetical protein
MGNSILALWLLYPLFRVMLKSVLYQQCVPCAVQSVRVHQQDVEKQRNSANNWGSLRMA